MEVTFPRMQGFSLQFIACDNYMQSPALFQNILIFCTFLPRCSNILPFLNIFLSFFWKIARMSSLCKIGPEGSGISNTHKKITHQHRKIYSLTYLSLAKELQEPILINLPLFINLLLNSHVFWEMEHVLISWLF